jgi:PAS domain-containing protein
MAVRGKNSKGSSRALTARSKRKTRDPTSRPATERAGKGAGKTEGRAFETLLRSDPELLRSLVDQAADALCLHQVDGRILDVNRRMCTTLGYSREELLALSVLDIDVNASMDETALAASRLVPGVPMTRERTRRKDA